MRYGLFATGDPESLKTWSGLPPFILGALQRNLGDVAPIAPMSVRTGRLFYMLTNSRQRVSGRWHPAHLNPVAIRLARSRLKAAIDAMQPELVFAIAASTLVEAVPDRTKVVYLTDGTFRLLHNYYDKLSNIPASAARRADDCEKRAISRADALVYSSEWAANSAVRDYGAPRSKITVVPFGANLPDPPSAPSPVLFDGKTLRLLLLGVEWKRKGADIAVDTASALRAKGIDATLTIVGCTPPDGTPLPPWVENIPFLSKNVPAEYERFKQLFQESHFFILPTRAECSAVVLGEAAAYGLPVMVNDTGGLRDMVADGETGWILPPDAGGEAYATRILELVSSPEDYATMRRNSRQRFENTLNWDAWAAPVANVARSLV